MGVGGGLRRLIGSEEGWGRNRVDGVGGGLKILMGLVGGMGSEEG